MATPAPLAQLFESQQDLAASVLSLLPLASLAALGCVSRSARALLAAQPESLWQVEDVCLCGTPTLSYC